MSLIEEILSAENMNEEIKKAKSNKGACSIVKMTIDNFWRYFSLLRGEIIESINNFIRLFWFNFWIYRQ